MGAVTGLRRVVRRRLRGRIPGPPLRGAQVELLQLVEAEPGIGVAASAQALHLAGNSVSTLVNQLVGAGYLLRGTDPADRRAARLHLTDAATERLTRWRSSRRELVGDALDRLPAAEVDALAAALPALHHLLDVLASAEETP
ncbi:MAG: MarR family transcriptional regulator [Pseudonocardia sp.]|nr:MarR family transcriptional regulator [Pseudonocardia sp.]